MSLIDQLHDVEQQVLARLRELEPAVQEYQLLSAEAARLGLQYAPEAAGSARQRQRAASPARSGGRRKSPAASSRRRARRVDGTGGRQADVLRLAKENPGITITQVGKQLGVDPTGLYRAVRKLQESQLIRKEGAGLHAVESPAETAVSETTPS